MSHMIQIDIPLDQNSAQILATVLQVDLHPSISLQVTETGLAITLQTELKMLRILTNSILADVQLALETVNKFG
jgi:Transcription factor Pcc1